MAGCSQKCERKGELEEASEAEEAHKDRPRGEGLDDEEPNGKQSEKTVRRDMDCLEARGSTKLNIRIRFKENKYLFM